MLACVALGGCGDAYDQPGGNGRPQEALAPEVQKRVAGAIGSRIEPLFDHPEAAGSRQAAIEERRCVETKIDHRARCPVILFKYGYDHDRWCEVAYEADFDGSDIDGPLDFECGSFEESAPPGAASLADCHPSYIPLCLPAPPPDLDCSDVRKEIGVEGGDPHGLDGDGNRLGCESYPLAEAPSP